MSSPTPRDVAGAAAASAAIEPTKYTRELVVLTSLFFMWGFLTCLNDILIPHLRALFSLNYAQAMLVQFTFFGAYFVVSTPSGVLVHELGYKRGIIIGLVVAGLGCLLFYPSAALRSYGLFLTAFFILASGITLLQVAANPYVTVLGRPETASSRLTLTQAFNSLGTTVAPYFGSVLILSTTVLGAAELAKLAPAELEAYRVAEAASVQTPYLGLALALFLIAGVFWLFHLPEIRDESLPADGSAAAARKSAWHYRHLVLGALAIFLYVGGEVAIGSFMVNFISDPEIGGLSLATAGKYLLFYWGGAMVGRFVGSAVMARVRPSRVLAVNAACAGLLVVATMLLSGRAAMVTILLVGLFNSIMFPTIFSLSVAGLGRHTSQGSGILCMAIVGGAIVPILQGLLADRIGVHPSYVLPMLCYVYIFAYALWGSTERSAGEVAVRRPA